MSRKLLLQQFSAKLLLFELTVTPFLDVLNELLIYYGFPVSLGQVVRGIFIVINAVVIVACGTRSISLLAAVVTLFYGAMSVRELSLGYEAVEYAISYWAKMLSFFLTFLAVRCAVFSGCIDKNAVERFFLVAIRVIAPAFILLAFVGVLSRSSFDFGYEGYILSKNSVSVVLLLLLSISLYYVMQNKLRLLWPVIIVVALFLLGSKSTIMFCAIMAISVVVHAVKARQPHGIFIAILLIVGMCMALLFFWDSVSSIVINQIHRYQFVVYQQGKSPIDYLLTGRSDLLEAGLESYQRLFNLLFLVVGCGVSTLGAHVAEAVGASSAFRSIEMDLFEIGLSSGLIGLLVLVIPFLIVIRLIVNRRPQNGFYLLLGIVVQILFLILGGHVVTEGMPAEYLGVFLAYTCVVSQDSSPEGGCAISGKKLSACQMGSAAQRTKDDTSPRRIT